MSATNGLFTASCVYTDDILRDFEALYLQKKELSPAARAVLGALGAAGAVYFGFMLWKEGLQLTRVGYLLICSILLLLALSRDRRADFKVDEEGLELHLEKQKNYARSKFKEIYGLSETDRCLYCVIKGKAYYIIPKDAVADGKADDLKRYLEKKCGKRFQKYEISAQ